MHLGCKIHKGQLHYTREDVDILELLLEHGGSDSVLKLAGEAKETAMHNVAQTGNVDIMSTLLGKLDRGKVQVSHHSIIYYTIIIPAYLSNLTQGGLNFDCGLKGKLLTLTMLHKLTQSL